MSPKKTRGSKGKSAAPAPEDVEAAIPSFGGKFLPLLFSETVDFVHITSFVSVERHSGRVDIPHRGD